MLESNLLLTALVILFAGLYSFSQTNDPLSPGVIFAPLLFYMLAFRPAVHLYDGTFDLVFVNRDALDLSSLVHLLGVSSFCLGLSARLKKFQGANRLVIMKSLTPVGRKLFLYFGLLLGAIATFVIWSMIWNTGGLEKILAQRKPFLRSPVPSGYYNELTKLAYPAMIMVASAWQGTRLTFQKILVLLIVGQAPIFLATACGRRGPMFLTAICLGASILIIKRSQLRVQLIISSLLIVGLMVLLVGEYRNRIIQPGLLFTEKQRDVQDDSTLTPRQQKAQKLGENYVVATAHIKTSNLSSHHFWGKRLFVQIIIRPIPKQLWPTKYEDTGMKWMKTAPGLSGFSRSHFFNAVGFNVPRGVAGGFISDLFLEFSWGFIIACYLIGYFYSALWYKSATFGNRYKFLYLLAIALSVFLIAQSVGAWLYKLILIGLPTWFVLKHIEYRNQRDFYRRNMLNR